MTGVLRDAVPSGAVAAASRLGAVEAAQEACAAAAESGSTFITVDAEGAAEAAAAADRRRQTTGARSLMDGIPVAVKDVIETRGLRTTMASRLFASHVPQNDAAVVADLRRAGAVIIGKTNSHEFSYGILGNVGAFGVVPNPHDPSRLAGGSSSGSAAAVALGIVPVAVGTDTAGSIRVPAALCGVAGFKPTLGAIDTHGVFPLSPTFDTVGYVGACVRDIETALVATGVLPGEGARDVGDVTAVGLRTFRAEVVDPVVGAPYDLAVQRLGAREVDPPAPGPDEPGWGELYATIRSREAYDVHQGLLGERPDLYQPATLERLLAGQSIPDAAVSAAKVVIARLRDRFLQAFTEADVLLCPSVPMLALRARDASLPLGRRLMSSSVPWNVLGWPALSIPHWVPGCPLPQSVQIVGKPGSDATVLRVGRLLERLLA